MIFLRMIAALYGWLVSLRNSLYDRGWLKCEELPGVVISVGNIAVGGTGKSPLVIDIAKRVIAEGGMPAIVTRGYRSGLGASEWQVLMAGKIILGQQQDQVGADEARMQSLALPSVPVIIGVRRLQAVRNFLRATGNGKITHFILDDGFQHRKIRRHQDIVALDVRNPAGALLPAGRFREPISSLSRAHDVVFTKSVNQSQTDAAVDLLRRIAPHVRHHELRMEAEPLRLMSGLGTQIPRRWAVVAGIAKPDDFLASLAGIGIAPVARFFNGDHQSLNPYVIQSARASFDGIVTTEKDWARDEARFRALAIPVYVLPLKPVWVGLELAIRY
jgi:tetraacyldisaccharide 4'-kinase